MLSKSLVDVDDDDDCKRSLDEMLFLRKESLVVSLRQEDDN